MAITVKRKNREIRDSGTISALVTGADVGKSLDFMGIPEGFRIVNANITVDEAFANANNTISLGIEGDLTRFIAPSAVDAIGGFTFNNRQFSAVNTTSIIADVVGDASATGKATVTVTYVKLPVSKQEY